MLPERRVGARGRHVVGKGAKVVLPEVHRHVGQRAHAVTGGEVRAARGVPAGGAGRGGVHRTGHAVAAAGAGVGVPVAVGGQDGEVLAAGQLGRTRARTPRTVTGILGEIVARTGQGSAERRAVVGAGVEDAIEPGGLVGVGETAAVVAEQALVLVDRNAIGVVLPDGVEADADVLRQLGEGVAGAGLRHLGAGAVERVPVGEVRALLADVTRDRAKRRIPGHRVEVHGVDHVVGRVPLAAADLSAVGVRPQDVAEVLPGIRQIGGADLGHVEGAVAVGQSNGGTRGKGIAAEHGTVRRHRAEAAVGISPRQVGGGRVVVQRVARVGLELDGGGRRRRDLAAVAGAGHEVPGHRARVIQDVEDVGRHHGARLQRHVGDFDGCVDRQRQQRGQAGGEEGRGLVAQAAGEVRAGVHASSPLKAC